MRVMVQPPKPSYHYPTKDDPGRLAHAAFLRKSAKRTLQEDEGKETVEAVPSRVDASTPMM